MSESIEDAVKAIEDAFAHIGSNAPDERSYEAEGVARDALDTLQAKVEEAERERDDYKVAASAEARLVDETYAVLKAEKASHMASRNRIEQLEGALRAARTVTAVWVQATDLRTPESLQDAFSDRLIETLDDLAAALTEQKDG